MDSSLSAGCASAPPTNCSVSSRAYLQARTPNILVGNSTPLLSALLDWLGDLCGNCWTALHCHLGEREELCPLPWEGSCELQHPSSAAAGSLEKGGGRNENLKLKIRCLHLQMTLLRCLGQVLSQSCLVFLGCFQLAFRTWFDLIPLVVEYLATCFSRDL